MSELINDVGRFNDYIYKKDMVVMIKEGDSYFRSNNLFNELKLYCFFQVDKGMLSTLKPAGLVWNFVAKDEYGYLSLMEQEFTLLQLKPNVFSKASVGNIVKMKYEDIKKIEIKTKNFGGLIYFNFIFQNNTNLSILMNYGLYSPIINEIIDIFESQRCLVEYGNFKRVG